VFRLPCKYGLPRDHEMTTPLPRRARAIVVLALLLAALAAPLGACGKKGAPSPSAGEPNTYPRSYPRE
jgi:hypothetical protein